MFDTLFLISYVVLWLLVLGMGFLLLGTLRSLGVLNWQLDELEATRPVRKAREGLKVGTKAPEFCLPDLDNVDRTLAASAGRNRLLVFVQPGCGPCHEVVPDLNGLQRAGDVSVIGIINGSAEEARDWADEVHARFPVLRQNRWSVSKDYKTYATPFGYLLDGEGRVTSRGPVGSSQYLRYVLNGAGNDSRVHQPDTASDEPARIELQPTSAAPSGELVPA